MPDTFRVIGQFTAALRWALPNHQPLTRNPWLQAMIYEAWTRFSTEAAEFVRAAATDLACSEPEHAYFSVEDDAEVADADEGASAR